MTTTACVGISITPFSAGTRLKERSSPAAFTIRKSPQADVAFKGKFLPSKATQDLRQLVKEYSLYFVGNEQERNDYYARKPYFVPLNYEIDYLLKLLILLLKK